MWTRVLVAELFIIIKFWNQPKWSSIVDRLNTFWHIHMMEYYAVVKKNEDDLHVLNVERS